MPVVPPHDLHCTAGHHLTLNVWAHSRGSEGGIGLLAVMFWCCPFYSIFAQIWRHFVPLDLVCMDGIIVVTLNCLLASTFTLSGQYLNSKLTVHQSFILRSSNFPTHQQNFIFILKMENVKNCCYEANSWCGLFGNFSKDTRVRVYRIGSIFPDTLGTGILQLVTWKFIQDFLVECQLQIFVARAVNGNSRN